MMRRIAILNCLVLLFFQVTVLHAQDSHWKVNIYGYLYDMTIYAQVHGTDYEGLTDYSNLEVAAFVGDECRGVGEIQSKDGYTWVYLRVRSNTPSGEMIRFKVYDKETEKETISSTSVIFQDKGLLGMPSSPISLIFIPIIVGDANLDGTISLADITAIINYLCGKPQEKFSTETADYDGNGVIDLVDIQKIASQLLEKKAE